LKFPLALNLPHRLLVPLEQLLRRRSQALRDAEASGERIIQVLHQQAIRNRLLVLIQWAWFSHLQAGRTNRIRSPGKERASVKSGRILKGQSSTEL
jgi:hypothetical protein